MALGADDTLLILQQQDVMAQQCQLPKAAEGSCAVLHE